MSQTPAPWSRQELLELCATDPERVDDLVFALWDQVDRPTQQVEPLTHRVHELERQLNQNRNSSKSPSSDGYKKPTPKSLRGKSDKPSGGQPGHPGTRLEMRKNPDHLIIHHPDPCEPWGHP